MDHKPLIIALLLATRCFAQTTFDPLTVAIGARPLAMGGAFTAVADDGNALFNNPAGLGEIDKVKFTSMSGTLIEDVNYTVLGGILPFGNRCSLGIGYAAAFVSGLQLRDDQGTLTGDANFSSNTAFLSIGKKLTERSSLGLSLKYYFSAGTGSSDAGSANWNVDVGLLQSGWDWLKLALVAENVISSNQPQALKAGSKLYLLGSGFDAAFDSPLELILTADARLYPGSSQPTTFHYGLEAAPNKALALRAGFDDGNPTAGIGLKIAGIGFNYAYHPYGDFAGNTASYFSIAYDDRDFPPEEKVPDVYLAKAPSL